MMDGGKEVIRILLVDDHAMVRAGLRMLLENHRHLLVVGEAASQAEAISAVRRERPHVTLLDLDLGKENGLDFIADLIAEEPEMRVLTLTGVRDQEMHRRAVRLGAQGVVMKDRAADVLVKAIEKVHAGEVWLDRSAMAGVLADVRRVRFLPGNGPQAAGIAQLTEREREIIGLVASGHGTKQLAARLFISEKTVRNHLASIYAKLGVCDRLELALFAIRFGLASGSPP
jgi:DNA-binding NarL/FixJ family response regulator